MNKKNSIKKTVLTALFITSIILLTHCSTTRVNKIILTQSIETRTAKHVGNFNLGLFLSPPFSDVITDYEENVKLQLLGLNACFLAIKPQIPMSFFLFEAEESLLGELHLYFPSKPFSPGIAVNRLWATHFKSTNFSFLLNFVGENFNICGSFGYSKNPIYLDEIPATGKVQNSSICINLKPRKNIGCFLTFSLFNILKGLKSYEEVEGEFIDVQYNFINFLSGVYLEF